MLPLMFLFVFALYSQDTVEDEAKDLEMIMGLLELMNTEVVTASKKAQSSADAPASIHVVTEQTIKNRGYMNLEELLEDIPEIEIQKKSVAEYGNYYSIRGIAGNEKFVILMNGYRVNSTTGTPFVVGWNYPLRNLKRVEVVIGPASALYGVDAFSGIINLITKSPSEMKGMDVSASYGAFGTYNASLMTGHEFGKVKLSAYANIYHSDEPFFPDYYEDDFKYYTDTYSKTGTVHFKPDNPFPYTAKIYDYDTPTDAISAQIFAEVNDFKFGLFWTNESHNSSVGGKPEFNIYTKEARYETNILSWYGDYNFTSVNNKWNLKSSINYNLYDLNPESRFINTFTDYKQGYKYASSSGTKFEQQVTYSPDEDMSFIAGISYERITALPKSGDLPFAYDPDKASDSQGLYYLGTNKFNKDSVNISVYQDFYYLEYQNFGSYAQLQMRLDDDLELTLGSRYDNNTRYGATINPRAGLVYSVSEETKIKLLYGSAFLAPSPYKAYQHYGAFVAIDTDSVFDGKPTFKNDSIIGFIGPFWHLPNPSLEPEKLKSYEASISHVFSDNLIATVSGYYTEVDNLIVDEVQSNKSFKGYLVAVLATPVNKGEMTSFGYTAKLDFQIDLGFGISTSTVSYSYNNGDLEGAPVPFTANNTIKGRSEINIDKLMISPSILYRSETQYTQANKRNSAFTTVNLFGRYNINKQLSAFMKITNLLDTRYYNTPFATDEFFQSTPQDPRKILFGMDIHF